ncbi:hypothetical protein Rhe02_69060 [Rhizocola hellebori]|uniref:Uncharacterized protein n=1 Tax=Rhizocola hellebori TaxID=1392758 RepID=A0A8J3QFS0_9ACTN|nr:hypothetical protein [Rhizocola hellebori]GIH08839.1 hypothetical protein Rhe02_69060 [Rhizocola hellebori]
MALVARHLRFGQALRDAWRLWRSHERLFLSMAVAVVTPLLVLDQFLQRRWDNEGRAPAAALLLLTGLVLAAFGEALCAGLAEHALRDELMDRPRRPLRVLLPLLPLGTLSVLAFIVGVTVTLGLAALLLPGLAIFAWLACASPAASFERHGVRAALATSVRLVRGRFWRVAAVTSVTFLPTAIGGAVEAWLHSYHPPLWLMIVVEALIESVVISYTAAVVVIVYHTLRAEAAQPDVAVDGDGAPG